MTASRRPTPTTIALVIHVYCNTTIVFNCMFCLCVYVCVCVACIRALQRGGD